MKVNFIKFLFGYFSVTKTGSHSVVYRVDRDRPGLVVSPDS